MTWTIRFLLPMAWFMLAAPLPAVAQLASCGGNTVLATLSSVSDGSMVGQNFQLSGAQCQDNVSLEFELRGLMPGLNSRLFLTTGTSCDQQDRRDGSEPPTDCTDPIEEELSQNQAQKTVTFTAQQLGCESTATNDVWFIVANAWMDAQVQSACLTLPVDSTAPSVPEGMSDRKGERALPIKWDASANADGYHVLFEPTGLNDAGDGCGGESVLKAGAAYEEAAELEGVRERSTGSTSYDLSPSAVGMPAAFVAVAAYDENQNVSALSKVICARFVNAYSFPERFESAGGEFTDGCSAVPGTRGRRTWALGLLAMAALWLRRRRA